MLFKKKKDKKANKTKNNGREISIDDTTFTTRHSTDNPNIIFGKNENHQLGVTVNSKTGGLTFITKDIQKAYETIVSSTIDQNNLSYVVYDPNKIAYNMCSEKLQANGYDVRVVDFSNNDDRIDPFETANIVSNAFWTASLITKLIDNPKNENEGSINLLLGMMQYLMTTKEKIKIADMKQLFEDICQLNVTTMKSLAICNNSKGLIKSFLMLPQEMRNSILTRMKTRFFDIIEPHANLFAVTTSSKKTALFITNCPKEKELLATIFLFNIRNISIFVDNGAVNTLLIDDVSADWYQRETLINVTKDSETRLGKGCAALDISTELGEFNNHVIVYEDTDSDVTKNIIRQCIEKNQMVTEELPEEKRTKDKRDPLDSVLNKLVVIDIDDLESTFACDQLEKSKN